MPGRGAERSLSERGKAVRRGGTTRKRTGLLPAILCLILLLAVAAAVFLPRFLKGKPEDALDAVFFDVGQADAILLSFPGGDHALIDAGNRDDAALLLEELRYRGVRRLAFAVCTHPHEDHAGGMETVLSEIPAETVYLSGAESDAGYYTGLLDLLKESGTPFRVPERGETVYDRAGCRVTAVYDGAGAETVNDFSLIFRVTYGKTSLLLTGDAEAAEEMRLLETGAAIRSDLVKLGHHGSVSSTSEAFLDAAAPAYAVISCGRNNDYGHPDREVLERLEARGIAISRTDREGTILFRSDGKSWERP